MSRKKKTTTAAMQASDMPQYAELLGEIKQRIRHAQTRAWMAVSAELIRLYWRIGQVIDSRQQQEGYGTAVIPRLARDLHNELPEEKGFSERNIKRMLAFYRLYPHAALESELVPQAVAQAELHPASSAALPVVDFPAPLLLAIPWGHHAVLMEKVRDAAARQCTCGPRWTTAGAVTCCWSTSIPPATSGPAGPPTTFCCACPHRIRPWCSRR
ncbi:DUF1016 N-terminal domain-containing protein [Methylogaea oryzae]|uniref:DUF1016 N-terminal domain-containing protein n=1 Tax=Methylogaea oryzae TaxID=1295382 RepID=UPI000A549F76|nr:DUF1016 N-terminal domain-containing protein [Methylogaea oryzae]